MAFRIGYCRRSRLSWFATAQQQTTDNRQQQVGARNVRFQKNFKFQKISENAVLLSKIDEMSKLLRRVALFDEHLAEVLEMFVFNRLGGGNFQKYPFSMLGFHFRFHFNF